MEQQRPVLWQSDDSQVILIDIPRSIASAQGTRDEPCHDLVCSTQAQAKPYQTNEPKSAAAREKLMNNTVDAHAHKIYAKNLNDAMDQIKAVYARDWCLPRPFIEASSQHSLKRKPSLGDLDESSRAGSTGNLHTSSRQQNATSSDVLPTLAQQPFCRVHGVESTGEDYPYQYRPPSQINTRGVISVGAPGDDDSTFDFFVPPQSSFVLGSCSDSRVLHQSVRAQAEELEVSKRFDFTLLDPPWPNRSVKRTHKTAHSTYATAASLQDIHQLIAGMDLDVLMTDSCLVAIWITNKPAVRDLVLGDDGLFDCWGVELVEEWIWLKTTVHGEPITPIDSVWRKPYEILLLGKKSRRYGTPSEAPSAGCGSVTRRVIMSVPDLHSRKPCLKDLIEPLMPDANNYRALEVFARHLVAGWWSWGNECIKFNEAQYWQRKMLAEEEDGE